MLLRQAQYLTTRACLLLVIWELAGCSASNSIKFPVTDLIYQSSRPGAPSIGFINSDGSGNTLLQVDFYATQPLTSSDAKMLYFREIPGHDASVDPGWLAHFSFWREGNSVANCGDKWWDTTAIVPLSNSSQVIVLLGTSKLLWVDLDSCQEIKTLLEYVPNQSKDISSPSISSDDTRLLYTERTITQNPPYQYDIMSRDISTGQVANIGQGINAVFSPDDAAIAYTKFDGIYVMNADGSSSHRVISCDTRGHNDYENAPPAPRWSPDGQWLVYHKCMKSQDSCSYPADYSIFKVNVLTGQEIKVLEGGLFPFWREIASP